MQTNSGLGLASLSVAVQTQVVLDLLGAHGVESPDKACGVHTGAKVHG